MQDGKKTKAQLIAEIAELRRRLAGQPPSENAREPEAAFLRGNDAPEGNRIPGKILRNGDEKPEQAVERYAAKLRAVKERLREAIEERDRAIAAHRKSEEHFREMFSKSPAIGLLIHADSGRIFDGNEAACRFYGYPPEKLRSMNIFDIRALPREEIAAEMRLAREGRCDFALVRHRLASGEMRDVEVHTNPVDLDGAALLHSSIRDVSHRRRTENKLRAANAFLENMLSNVHCLIACLDTDFNLTRVNHAFAETFGHPQQFFTGKSYFEFCSDTRCESIFRQVAATGVPCAVFEDSMCLAQESPVKTAYWDWSLHPVMSENGRAESLVLCMVDRTRHKIAQDELACERDKLTGILEAMQDGVYIIKSDCSIEYLNPVAVREFGPIDGKKCYEYFNDLPQQCDWCTNADTYDGRSTRSIWSCIRNGKTYDVFDTPIRNTDGSVSKLSILHDVTEHRAIQDALRLDEARLQALLELSRMTEETVEEVTGFALQQLVSLTGSESGFLGFLDDSGETFTLHAVAHSSGEECSVSDYPAHSPVAEAGLWQEAWSSRKPLILNDFHSQPPRRCSMMEGHGPLARAMSVPVFSGTRLVGIAAVANKGEDYDLSDLRQLTLLADGMWRFFERRKAEESLKESEKQLRFLSSKLLSVWESERERLAQELHDRIGQTLAAVKFGVENCLNARGRSKVSFMLLSLQGVIPLLQKAMREVRNIYMHLRPTILDDFGVLAAIGWLCRESEKLNPDVRIEQAIRLQEKDVAEPLKIVIFRIVQEALTNMERHSGAGKVWLTAAKKRGEISLSIRDDGQGFDPRDILAADDTERGLGLASMQEQTRQSGGTFTVESSKGEGTLVRATWPACCG